MGSHMREDGVDLDLNQEPLDPPPLGSIMGLGSLLNDIESVHGRIEERIRQLEVVTSRARQRQRWRQAPTPPETMTISMGPITNTGVVEGGVEGRLHTGECSIAAQERTDESGKSCKRESTHLIAKALGMDAAVKKAEGDGGSFFDCNICLDTARDPILTCCGHLFCWACFYQLPVHSNAKECPVCKGEVTDANITPIYCNGNYTRELKLEDSGLKVPPRPPAQRKESFRQQLVNRGVSNFPIEETIRRFSNRIATMGERTRRLNLDGERIASQRTNYSATQIPTSQVLLPHPEAEEGIQRLHSLRFLRLLSQDAASLSTLSSALNSAERLVEDLESYIQTRRTRRHQAQSPQVEDRDSFMSIAAVIQSESQTLDSAAEINSSGPVSSSSSRRRNDVSAVVQLENPTTDTAIEINLTVPHSSSSSRRRDDAFRGSDADNGVSRETRRRRLR